MISVLSNYLDPLIDAGLLQDAGNKPSEIYKRLAIAYNQGLSVREMTLWYVPYYDKQNLSDLDTDLLCYIRSNKDLRKLIKWFNFKIIPEFVTMTYQTIGVRIGIFCRKLNKLVDDGLVDKDRAIKIHSNLVDTLRKEKYLIVDEDLPF